MVLSNLEVFNNNIYNQKTVIFKFKNFPKCFTAYNKAEVNTRNKNHFVLLIARSVRKPARVKM